MEPTTKAIKSKKDCSEKYMAIKTDISKAYDRVEWKFLQEAMEGMGFTNIWTQWIMKCVTSVTYSVMVNGSAYGHITPTRGIRQGDPLSPFLFILCVEVLSQMIDNAERNKQINGIKISKNGPAVTHLLFADDSLFFCGANAEECGEFASILQHYEEISGQKVNYEKSSIIFGTKIPNQRRVTLQGILGITKIGGGGKYLGLPEQFGRRKTQSFEHLVDRVRDRIAGWYNQFLSPAGKEVLIKSVVQSIPVYSMNCFLIPKGICDDIHSLLTEFWWGTNDGKRKIPWISWKKLSLSKKEGGMGFKDLHSFNLALLAKQAWRIQKNPTSLLSRIYQARYHNTSSFLQSRCGKQISFGWRSMQAGKNLLLQGSRKQIGDGKQTDVWKDAWLPKIPPKVIMDPEVKSLMTVSDLWKHGTKEWDEDKLKAVLQEEDAALAKTIILSKYNSSDFVIWPFNNNSVYSVKSGYWFATHYSVAEVVEIPHGSLELKQEIWKLKILPKIKHFLWRAISEALSTATRMISRNIKINPVCQRCCVEDETINHVLFECPHAIATWRCAQIPTLLMDSPSDTFEENFKQILRVYHEKEMDIKYKILPFWTMWMIWKSRNEFLFNKRNVHPIEDVRRSQIGTQEWIVANGMNQVLEEQEAIPPSTQWIPPSIGWLKCNFDCSYHHNGEYTGLGWILRDHCGKHVMSGSTKITSMRSVLQGEAMSFLHSLQMVWSLGCRNVNFETDNKELANLIYTQEQNLDIGNILFDIHHWTSKLPLCSLNYINRERNQAADILAKKALEANVLYSSYTLPPLWLIDYLYFPFTI